jgi:hypothetical protein
MRAGLKPIVEHMLAKTGYQTASRGIDGLPAGLPEPELLRVRPLGPVDDQVFSFCRQHDLGLIHYDKQRVDPVWLAAQLAIAFPHTRMAAVMASADHARQFAKRIRRWVPGTPVVTAKRPPRRMERVVVSTLYGLGHCEIEKLELIVLLRATDAIHKRGLWALQYARRARMYGFLESEAKVAPRDRDWLTAVLGPAELRIPQAGHRAIPMNVIWTPMKAANLPLDMGLPKLRRKGIEQHPIRNRRITRLTCALVANDRSLVSKDYSDVSPVLNRRSNLRVAILVTSVEHALALAARLKGWPILTAPEVILNGLSPEERHLLETRRRQGPVDPPYIATTAAADNIDYKAIDVLVWGGGGDSLPPLPPHRLVCPSNDNHRLTVIDFADRHHPQLRRWSRQRRQAYQAAGWWAPGTDPIPARIEHFLATRPGRPT